MGEFTGGQNPGSMANNDVQSQYNNDVSQTGDTPNPELNTDVEGVTADSTVKHGKDTFPVFDVNKQDFFQNMENGRKRIRFASDSKASQYMRGTKYNRAFYIRHTDQNGKKYMRRVK